MNIPVCSFIFQLMDIWVVSSLNLKILDPLSNIYTENIFLPVYGLSFYFLNSVFFGNSLVVQWLRLRLFTAECLGLIPGQGTKIPRATQPRKNSVFCLAEGFSFNQVKIILFISTCVLTCRDQGYFQAHGIEGLVQLYRGLNYIMKTLLIPW